MILSKNDIMMVLSRNEAVSYEKKRLPEDQADARQTLLPCNKTSWRGSRSDRRRGDRRRLWRLERGGARERRLATRNKHDATSDDPTRTKRHKLEKPQLAHTLFLLRIFSTFRTDSWDWSSGSDRTVIWATSSTKSVKKTGQIGNANICGKKLTYQSGWRSPGPDVANLGSSLRFSGPRFSIPGPHLAAANW
jgi:hypothetical protein